MASPDFIMATIKLDKERELKFNLNALKKIKEKFGSLQEMQEKLTAKTDDPLDVIDDIIWLITLLANQPIIELNMDIKRGIAQGKEEPLLDEEYVSLKFDIKDMIAQKQNIFAALASGMAFTAVSPDEETDEVLAEIDSQKNA